MSIFLKNKQFENITSQEQTKNNYKQLINDIQTLKKDLNAIILAHYYQEPDIQDVADFLGDSLGLAREAAKTNADIIVFAGVHFMAETAKILNPEKMVLLPDLNAGCSLADSCPPEIFSEFKKAHSDHLVISYINCSASIKAMSDIICTSANAVDIVNKIPLTQPILFAPDQNLGRYVISKTGRDLLLWPGSCIVHETFSEKKIFEFQSLYPTAEVIAHPECEPTILKHANYIGSTTSLLQYVKNSKKTTFIVITEPGIIHQMKKSCPEKQFLALPTVSGCACNECPHMRLNTLEKLYLAMKTRSPQIEIPESILLNAKKPIERMLEMSN
uniref:Quinolinate synthase n=1 Tax=Cyanophora paradoxa TaxID=2762 RepID=NADA_CYAPA|nr:quinolinate synthetase [Cyanophora paradoxa]P31179.1 RecName: Full=Quinolinate synthase [Cyanophora paradoxa]AAA65473.1 quinolinate synthetase [Cyanophora paradoxa]AAA81216.1 quinolinate synthetase [Cyanophora paradoxa]prf//1808319A quinolinate synthetase [Cyanophora paradoxa]